MSKNPEGRFYAAVERPLKALGIHCEGMANPYRGGTPDRYYEGPKGGLWVEYKWYNSLPAKEVSLVAGKTPKLTDLQQRWLNRAHSNGVKVLVIVGFPGKQRDKKSGFILGSKTWMNPLPANEYETFSLSSAEIAHCLAKMLGASNAAPPPD